MKILEVKNNLVKISYTAEDKPILGGFVIIEDSQYPYVAQIMSLKADSGFNYAIVKLLFTFNEEGIVKNYNGTVPELNAVITILSADELLDILPIETPLTIGKLAQQKFILNIDYSALEKNMLICSDKTENTDILLSNFAKQITEQNNKSVIFDTDNTINAENRLVFGTDFKLPLNYDTINFIYENDLNDVNPESKAVIQDIFLEVQEYSKTVLDNFIPFDSFIAVVEAQYRELNIPELALLKSRLMKYKEENVFAQDAKEFQSIRAAIRGNMSTLFDISQADDVLQKQIISYIYDEIDAMDLFVYSIVKINDDNSDKKLIRKFLTQDKIYTVIAAPHNYKYMYELKDRASNIIMFAPQTTVHDFAAYNIFLGKLNDDECVIYGKATQNIPLILEVHPLEALNSPEPETKPEKVEEEPADETDDFSQDSDSYSYETMVEDDVTATDSEPQTEDEVETDVETEVESEIETEDEPKTDIEQEQFSEDTMNEETLEEIPEIEGTIEQAPVIEQGFDEDVFTNSELSEDFSTEHTELDNNLDDNYIDLPYIEEENSEQIENNTQETQTEDLLPTLDDYIEEEHPQQDNLTETDLDYLQDVNMPEEDLNSFDDLEDKLPEVEEENTPVVPVYSAEELTAASDDTMYEPGDRVSHPKYGEGIVEKMLKYGNKMLCSINFENCRRLLDPTISELKKL